MTTETTGLGPGANLDAAPTILLIEDDDALRETVAAYLTSHGYRVKQAASGMSGIALYHDFHPDIILCDLSLPDMDGFAALGSILEESPELPIVVLADRHSTQDAIQAIRLGVSDYLLKPLQDMEILGLSVVNSLRRAALLSENSRYRRKLEAINRELENTVETFKHDQQAGRHVQMSMLPASPQQLSGYHFEHGIIPSLFLSGDSVDYKPLSRNRVLFYIADVSGHGSSSAFITVLLRFRIEQMRREHIRSRFADGLSPATLLQSLNKDLLDAGLDKHITLFVGLLDRSSERLTYSVAGHYPLPVLLVGDKVGFIPLQQSSLPIGLSEEASYFEESLVLDKPFSLTLFSDGIMEILEMESIADKEAYLLDVIKGCEGSFHRIKDCLKLDEMANVPDDIALMSVVNP